MINYCRKCENPIMDGQRIQLTVTATYHLIPSSIYCALNKNEMEADMETMEHEDCNKTDRKTH